MRKSERGRGKEGWKKRKKKGGEEKAGERG